jgi:hypothetical protein
MMAKIIKFLASCYGVIALQAPFSKCDDIATSWQFLSCEWIIRRCLDPSMTQASFQSGILTDPAPDKPRVTTAKSSSGKRFFVLPSFTCLELICLHILLLSSPQAIFRDPFRKGKNILVKSRFSPLWFITRKVYLFMAWWIFSCENRFCNFFMQNLNPV